MKGLVVLPTYDERTNLRSIVDRLLALDPGCGVAPLEILVVDDASPDGTGELAEELAREAPGRLRVLHRPRKEGLGRAYLDGFREALAAGYDLVFEMDADLSHDPEELPRLVEAVVAGGADLALGSRYAGGVRVTDWNRFRLAVSRFGNAYARVVTGLPFADLTGGFKCFRRRVLEAIDLDAIHSVGYAFQVEMTWWATRRGFRVVEVPITFRGREDGETKFSKGIVVEAIVALPLLRLGWYRNEPPRGGR